MPGALRAAIRTTFSVAIDLEKALANPGGEADVILRENDVLHIPVCSNVVRIQGAVKYPTAVNYDARKRARDYINDAGGLSDNARPRRAYIVNMGGRAKRVRSWTKVEPGSEIYVPLKPERQKKEINYAAISAITSATASLATVSLSIMYIIRNNTSK